MLDLAESPDGGPRGATFVGASHKVVAKAPGWPSDSDFELVAFSPSGRSCEIVRARDLAGDIAMALATIEKAAALKGRRPDWYRRLKRYAKGAPPA